MSRVNEIVPKARSPASPPPSWARFVFASLGAAMVVVSLCGMYFRSEVAAYVHHGGQTIPKLEVDAKQRGKNTSPSPDPVSMTDNELTQPKITDTSTAGLQEALIQERARYAALERELKTARRALVAQSVRVAQTSDEIAQLRQIAEASVDLQQSVIQERAKSSELESELSKARREIEQAVVSRKSEGRTRTKERSKSKRSALR